MYSDRAPKDFSEAMRHYERAALLEPSSGNAQNQVRVPTLAPTPLEPAGVT
jgi:hypothetical protein